MILALMVLIIILATANVVLWIRIQRLNEARAETLRTILKREGEWIEAVEGMIHAKPQR